MKKPVYPICCATQNKLVDSSYQRSMVNHTEVSGSSEMHFFTPLGPFFSEKRPKLTYFEDFGVFRKKNAVGVPLKLRPAEFLKTPKNKEIAITGTTRHLSNLSPIAEHDSSTCHCEKPYFLVRTATTYCRTQPRARSARGNCEPAKPASRRALGLVHEKTGIPDLLCHPK